MCSGLNVFYSREVSGYVHTIPRRYEEAKMGFESSVECIFASVHAMVACALLVEVRTSRVTTVHPSWSVRHFVNVLCDTSSWFWPNLGLPHGTAWPVFP